MAKFELTTSNQARYLSVCVSMLRQLQKPGHARAAAFMEICQREAGYIISGDYCKWGAK